jgi:SCY1-like protein 1
MDDGDNDFFASGNETPSMTSSTTLPKREKESSTSRTVSGSAAAPYDDGSEPDFAGWLAAQQAQKKKSTVSGIKGLSKATPAAKPSPSATTTAKKTLPASKPKAAPAKKIDMKPKETDDDDGWGDGW